MEQLTLFDEESVSSRRSPNLMAVTEKKETVIYWKSHIAVVAYKNDDALSKRMAAAFLIQTKIGTYDEVASVMGWAVSTVHSFMRDYRKKGPLGLIKQKTGPKNWKVTPEIHQFIIKTKGKTYNELVQLIKETHGVSLSVAMISYIKNGVAHRGQLHLFEDELLESLFGQDEKEMEDDQTGETSNPLLNTTLWENMPKEKKSDTAEIVEDAELVTVPETVDVFQSEGTTTPSRYAGGFLLLPFLKQIDPFGLFQGVREKAGITSEHDEAKSYNLKDFMYTLLFLLWFRFSSIEDFKFVQPKDFGVLISKERAPSVKTLRRNFPAVLNGEIIGDWMLELVKQYIKLDVIELGALYFDGHKIPYYGHVDLPKGYLSSKRFPAKLIEQVFANDRSGRPIFLRVHDTSLSFRDTILSMIKDAQELWEENVKGKSCPLIVAFDRELYDTTLFAELDRMSVIYITWRKFDKPVSVDKLTGVIVETETDDGTSGNQPPVKYRFWRRHITVQGYRTEAISFLSESKAKKDPGRSPSTLVTNADKFRKSGAFPEFEPPSTEEIIDFLCGRWRQENYFRYSKHGEGLDYNPQYRTQERQEARTRANPEIKEEKKEIQKLKKEIDKLNEKITSKLVKRKNKDKPMKDVMEQKSIKKLVQQKEQKELEIQEIRERTKELPERVPVDNGETSSLELELHGKLFLDVLRIVMHNAEQMLLDVFKRCYSDPRDVRKVLREIATQGGTVTEYHDHIEVELTALPIPAHRRATENLFNELNAARHAIESNDKTIFFKIKNSPS